MLRRTVYTVIILLLILVLAGVAQAQSSGTVRGTIYQDLNADGVCVGTGDPVLAGVPIELVTADGQTTVNLESGSDGTFGMVAAGFGTWNVTAIPGEGFSVTGQQTRSVTIGSSEPEVTGADFCVAQVTTSSGGTATVLPESGAGLSSSLLAATAVGLAFIMIGAGLELRRRLLN
jgi:hypothetical protein